MANTLKFGNGEWYGKEDTILAYNDERNNIKPLPFSFERGSVATRINKEGLIETVGANEPRVDYKDDSKGALLLEPSRSNLIPNSNFDDGWELSNSTKTLNSSTSPEGNLNAVSLKSSTSSSNEKYIRRFVGVSASTDYTFSVFAKKNELSEIRLSSTGNSNAFAFFNLSNGTIESVGSSATAEIENFGNGWFRCSIKHQNSITGIFSVINLSIDGSVNISTNVNDGVYLFGSQYEQSYATSYIPTQGGAVTRLADSCNNGGNEQVINSTEGTLYVEANLIDGYDNNNWLGIIYDNSNANNRVYIQRYLGNIQGGIRVNGVIQSEITQSNSSLGKNKIAFTFKQNEFKLFVNGSQVSSTDTSGSVFSANTLNTLNVGVYHDNTLQFNSGIDDVKLYNIALTDQELQALTTI